MKSLSVKDLTAIQQQRYYSLAPIYGDSAIDIVINLTTRGKNSYSDFLDKMHTVIKAKHDANDYYSALYESITLGDTISPGEVIQKVSDVRRELELEPYREKLKIQCEADFFLLFVFEEVHQEETIDGKTKKVLVGYKPLAKVRPES